MITIDTQSLYISSKNDPQIFTCAFDIASSIHWPLKALHNICRRGQLLMRSNLGFSVMLFDMQIGGAGIWTSNLLITDSDSVL